MRGGISYFIGLSAIKQKHRYTVCVWNMSGSGGIKLTKNQAPYKVGGIQLSLRKYSGNWSLFRLAKHFRNV